jgi:hypothetical protein
MTDDDATTYAVLILLSIMPIGYFGYCVNKIRGHKLPYWLIAIGFIDLLIEGISFFLCMLLFISFIAACIPIGVALFAYIFLLLKFPVEVLSVTAAFIGFSWIYLYSLFFTKIGKRRLELLKIVHPESFFAYYLRERTEMFRDKDKD